ncbi:MAG: thioredoxin family protein [Candidatus Cyclobacteriaceae bacterium M2_1C_046]
MKTKLFFVFALLAVACSSETPHEGGYEVGDIARDFELKNVDDDLISLSDYNDAKGYIVVFTCNTCPYSEYYEQRIIDLHNKYAKEGFPVIAINPNDPIRSPGDSFGNMKELAEEKKYPFPYVLDETQQVTKDYGATNTPHVYILNNDKKVVYIGAIDNNPRQEQANKFYVQDAVEALKNNQMPEVTKTKAIGCTIKWALW